MPLFQQRASFVALCEKALESRSFDILNTTKEKIEQLKSNKDFQDASQSNTAGKSNVDARLNLAQKILY
jgi:hypothetical protein